MERYFNTAGPNRAECEYTLNPLSRFDLEDILGYIAQGKYFVLHAPRQTGKTSCMLALRDYLNASDNYISVYANVEGGQASRNDVQSVVKSTIDTLTREVILVTKNESVNEIRNSVQDFGKDSMLAIFLSRLSETLDKPLVLILDGIDALVGDSLVSVRRQLRAGYANRPKACPQTVILCGVRDVRDYRIVLSNQVLVTGGSAFNIKAMSLPLVNFSKEDNNKKIIVWGGGLCSEIILLRGSYISATQILYSIILN